MTLLFLGAVLLASVPMLAGVVIGAFVPGLGRPAGRRRGRHPAPPAVDLPGAVPVATVTDAVGKYFRGAADRSMAGQVAELAVLWLALTLMLTVFFERLEASAVAALLYWPFVRYLEWNSADDQE